MKRRSLVVNALLAAATLAVAGLTLLDTRVEWLGAEAAPSWQELATQSPFLAGPAAVLLFAFGVQHAARRRLVAALACLPALPIWSLCYVELPSFSGNLYWAAIFLAPMQGIQPFGAPPA